MAINELSHVQNCRYIAALENIGLLGFIAMSQVQALAWLRLLPLLVALMAIGYVGYSTKRGVSYKEVIGVAMIASAISIAVVQLLGFTLYTGLAKDINFLSGENLTRTTVMLLVGTIAHVVLLIAVRVGKAEKRA